MGSLSIEWPYGTVTYNVKNFDKNLCRTGSSNKGAVCNLDSEVLGNTSKTMRGLDICASTFERKGGNEIEMDGQQSKN